LPSDESKQKGAIPAANLPRREEVKGEKQGSDCAAPEVGTKYLEK